MEEVIRVISSDLSAQQALNQGSYNLPSSKITYAIDLSGIPFEKVEQCVLEMKEKICQPLSNDHPGVTIIDVTCTSERSTKTPYILVSLDVS